MSAGFISLKNNSTAVTGSGTDFKTDLAEGDFIIATVGGVTYTLPVKTITDATNLIMAREYNGPAQGNIAWTAMPRDTLNSISAQIAADTAYAIRSRILEINNWYQLLETNGDVTIKMADGSTYTGPSWLKICDLANASDLSKIQPLADQIHRDATQVAGDKTAADNSAKAASASASGAASSATAAKGSADTAGGSATAAAKSASDAAGSATAAKNSADTAGGSATAAAKSAGNAAGSATAAKGSADTAGSNATAAAKSAGDAAGSATAAKNSADTAGGSATAAAKSAGDAAGSATAAKHSADTAGSSATAAAGSASSAGTSETHAASSATSASQSADRAEAAARNASAGTVKTVNGKAPDDEGGVTLGSAADADIVTSMTDTTAGRVPVVGYGGWGIANGTTIFLKSIFDIACSGAYNALGKGNETPTAGVPDDSGNTRYAVLATNIYASLYWVALISNKEYYVGNVDVSKKTAVWERFYCSGYKPTAADTGALPLTGGKLTGNLEINDNAPIIQFSEADTGKKYFIVVDGSGLRIDEDSTAGNSILSYAGASKQMKTVGQFVPGDYGNFDSRYLKLTGGNVTGTINQDGVPQATYNETALTTGTAGAKNYLRKFRGGSADTVWHETVQGGAYRLATGNTDVQEEFSLSTSGIASFRGQVIPGNYTNFDNRYGGKNSASKADNGWFKDASTGLIFQWGKVASSSPTNVNVTFPIAFPSKCVSVQNTIIRPNNNGGANNWTYVTSLSATGASIGTDSYGAYWFAIGY
ncbi:gp53-like domain-containing protein [Enterobacter sp. PTB]|uniref:gp53-like domain-containing protein n=1 Tax=Enterobacter sp. PTB TaxID=3143437 RepID=UPI003DA9047A